jgi:hypothetical protein
MCGATDCPSCGPAQGYEVRRVWRNGRFRYVNPEDDDDGDSFDEPDPQADDDAADRYQRDIERNYP